MTVRHLVAPLFAAALACGSLFAGAPRASAGGPQPEQTLKDCSAAKTCDDRCYCEYDNCSMGCKDGDIKCVNACIKALHDCQDGC